MSRCLLLRKLDGIVLLRTSFYFAVKNKLRRWYRMDEFKLGNNEIYMEENGEVIARIQFVPSGSDENGKELITVKHTIVNEGHNGKGLGKKLVNRIVEYAKEENKAIIPECTYAKKVLESNEEFREVLAKR
ncbi:GNAT family N-acetyltransferase [Schinkia azotoformans]|uniref:GNAT family N-acetyltransferase n=1 Tax=Schinkia azotoformans TaxID=1454 RepID=UPI002E208FE7|nr:GNAT family N-acetyltransferase [Schinkia azotoformans]